MQNATLSFTECSNQFDLTSSGYQSWCPPTRSEGGKVIYTLFKGSRSQGRAIHSILCMKTKTSVNWKLPKEVGWRKQVFIALKSLENMTKTTWTFLPGPSTLSIKTFHITTAKANFGFCLFFAEILWKNTLLKKQFSSTEHKFHLYLSWIKSLKR